MMFCTKCGAKLEDMIQFCTQCGEKLKPSVAQVPVGMPVSATRRAPVTASPPVALPVATPKPVARTIPMAIPLPENPTPPQANVVVPAEVDIKFHCAACRQPLETPSDMAGERIDCPACSANIQVPSPNPVSSRPPLPPSFTSQHRVNSTCQHGSHSWTGCKCTKCNATRDEGHDWSKVGAKFCARCAKPQQEGNDRTTINGQRQSSSRNDSTGPHKVLSNTRLWVIGSCAAVVVALASTILFVPGTRSRLPDVIGYLSGVGLNVTAGDGQSDIPITRKDMETVLLSPSGTTLAFSTQHEWRKPVTIRGMKVAGTPAYEVWAMVADATKNGDILKTILPMGPGTVYKVFGKVQLFGHTIEADGDGSLELVVRNTSKSEEAKSQWKTDGPLVGVPFPLSAVTDQKDDSVTPVYLSLAHKGGKGHATLRNGKTIEFR